jgi:hypothetical protein
MSSLEQRLHDALTGEAVRVQPAGDLFARVRTSVDADRRRRRRRRILAASTAAVGVLAVVAAVAVGWRPAPQLMSHTEQGGTAMRWWVLELATDVLLAVIALWLGPFIKRFGRAYAADVFHDNPLTGKSYIVLTDIVYYLIFTAYILFTVSFAPHEKWGMVTVRPEQVQFECARIGGILLIIGVLHGLNIILLPVLGRLFSLNRRLQPPTTLAPSQREWIESPD